ncbi:MAG: anti-anti-sigma regulatory factor, partial [Gammaproteobacteria bacterium]
SFEFRFMVSSFPSHCLSPHLDANNGGKHLYSSSYCLIIGVHYYPPRSSLTCALVFAERLLVSIAVISGSKIEHVVFVCSAVNHIDYSAIESLISLNRRLDNTGVKFHLSEVKDQVSYRLNRSDLMSGVTVGIFVSQHEAFFALK